MVIRNHLLTKGFDAFESAKEWQTLLPQRSPHELKKLLEHYKREANKDDPFHVLNLILGRCKEQETSMFYDLFSNVLKRKAEQIEGDDKQAYREAYLFLATLLEGEMPSVAGLSDRAVVILLMLTKNLNHRVESIPLTKVLAAIKAGGDDQRDARVERLMAKLNQQTKFRHINTFLRPLNITPQGSEAIFEQSYSGTHLEEEEDDNNQQEEAVEGEDVQMISGDQCDTL